MIGRTTLARDDRVRDALELDARGRTRAAHAWGVFLDEMDLDGLIRLAAKNPSRYVPVPLAEVEEAANHYRLKKMTKSQGCDFAGSIDKAEDSEGNNEVVIPVARRGTAMPILA